LVSVRGKHPSGHDPLGRHQVMKSDPAYVRGSRRVFHSSLARNLPERSGSPLGTVVLSAPFPGFGERFLARLGMTGGFSAFVNNPAYLVPLTSGRLHYEKA
jgi:hypothetical protein